MNDRYELTVRERTKAGTGFTFEITHPDRPGWSEGSVVSFKSAQDAANAGQEAIDRLTRGEP
jgi:hypothetical protein